MKIRLSELKNIIKKVCHEERRSAAEYNLMFDKKSVLVPDDIKKKIKLYFKQMGLSKMPLIRKKKV